MPEAVQATTESVSSVELTRNAKGGTQIKVKVYNENADEASSKCEVIYKALCKEYSE